MYKRQVVLRLIVAHGLQKLLPALEHILGIQTGDLAHAQILLGNVELLEVAVQQLLGGFAVKAAIEEKLAQLVEGDVGNAGHALGHGHIPLGAGGGFEHDSIG